jgi:hypothetical protein
MVVAFGFNPLKNDGHYLADRSWAIWLMWSAGLLIYIHHVNLFLEYIYKIVIYFCISAPLPRLSYHSLANINQNEDWLRIVKQYAGLQILAYHCIHFTPWFRRLTADHHYSNASLLLFAFQPWKRVPNSTVSPTVLNKHMGSAPTGRKTTQSSETLSLLCWTLHNSQKRCEYLHPL